MTIDELNALTTLTAADEVPVWDSEESGEPTKKITGSNLASSVKTLGSLLGTSDVVNNLTSTETDKPLSAAQGKILNDKIENVIVQAVKQADPGTTESEYTFINNLKLSDYKMLVATRAWYSNVLQSQCIPIDAFPLAPLEIKDGNEYVKVTFVSDTKVKIVSSVANMRCSIYLTR